MVPQLPLANIGANTEETCQDWAVWSYFHPAGLFSKYIPSSWWLLQAGFCRGRCRTVWLRLDGWRRDWLAGWRRVLLAGGVSARLVGWAALRQPDWTADSHRRTLSRLRLICRT
jgi:hypothetical protein